MERQIHQIVSQFAECRDVWFDLCVRLLAKTSTTRLGCRLAGKVEVTVRAYQYLDALEVVAAKQYIPPAQGRDFANKLFAELVLVEGQNPLMSQKEFQQMSNAREKDGDVFILSTDVAEAIVVKADYAAGMTIAPSVALFTNFNHWVVARVFGDHAAVKELERKRDTL